MSPIDLILQQLTDPFRVGLLAALVATMLRTEAATGRLKPLAAGAVFVAALIPLTVTRALAADAWLQFATGLGVNAVWLVVLLGAWTVYRRLRGK